MGCLKLQVSFRKRATGYGALWRKMIYNDKASYGSPPLLMYDVPLCGERVRGCERDGVRKWKCVCVCVFECVWREREKERE